MKEKKRGRHTLSVVVPKRVKEEIVKVVQNGEYKSASDFLRKAVYRLLEKRAEEEGDILKEKRLRQFIEKIS